MSVTSSLASHCPQGKTQASWAQTSEAVTGGLNGEAKRARDTSPHLGGGRATSAWGGAQSSASLSQPLGWLCSLSPAPGPLEPGGTHQALIQVGHLLLQLGRPDVGVGHAHHHHAPARAQVMGGGSAQPRPCLHPAQGQRIGSLRSQPASFPAHSHLQPLLPCFPSAPLSTLPGTPSSQPGCRPQAGHGHLGPGREEDHTYRPRSSEKLIPSLIFPPTTESSRAPVTGPPAWPQLCVETPPRALSQG